MTNPYNIDFLQSLFGQQETELLEFKSSRELSNESADKRAKFISSQIVPAVSAFLNTDGGRLVIGMEEGKNGIAAHLSEGVPRSRISAHQLQSSICSRIQPAVAGHVSVCPVRVAGHGDENLNAFVVDVRQGITAYQADDKKYYVRRAGQNEAMEDKDIRLRMTAGDKPRISISLRHRLQMSGLPNLISGVAWILLIENVGMKTIPDALIRLTLDDHGIPEGGKKLLATKPRYQKTDFSNYNFGETSAASGLRPGDHFECDLFDLSSLTFRNLPGPLSEVSIILSLIVFVDDGPATELSDYDLMTTLRPIVSDDWMLKSG